MTSIKDILTTSGYFQLLMARICSSVSIWMDFILIFSTLSFSFQATPFTIGVATALYGFPGLILGPWIGAAADRYSPALVLLLSASAGSIISFLFCGAITGTIQLFIAIIFLKGISNLGAFPAEQIIINRLLSDNQMIFTTRLFNLIDQLSKIFAPLLGGVCVQFMHSKNSFILSALLGVIVSICAISIGQVIGWKEKSSSSFRWKPDFKTVVILLRKDIKLAVSLFLVVMLSLTLGLYDSMLVSLLKEKGLPVGSFGIIVSCTAVGAIICTVVLKSLLKVINELSMMFIFLYGFSSTIIAAGLAAFIFDHLILFPLCILWIINGFCYSGVSMGYIISLQRSCPQSLLGTISSSGRSLQLGALILGPIVGSLIAKIISIPLTFVGVGMFSLILGTVANRFIMVK